MTLKKTTAFKPTEGSEFKLSLTPKHLFSPNTSFDSEMSVEEINTTQDSKRLRLTNSALDLRGIDISDDEGEGGFNISSLRFNDGYSSEPEHSEAPRSPSKKARSHTQRVPYLERLQQKRSRANSTSSIRSIENETNPFMPGSGQFLNGHHHTIIEPTKGSIHWVAIVHQHQEEPASQNPFASPQTPGTHTSSAPQTPQFMSPPQVQQSSSPHTPGEASGNNGQLQPTHVIKRLMTRHTLKRGTFDTINAQIEESMVLLQSKGFACLDRTYCGDGFSISPYLENEVDVTKFRDIGVAAITTALNMLLTGELTLAQFPDISASNIRTTGIGDAEQGYFCDFLEFPRSPDDFECDFGTIYRSWESGFAPDQKATVLALKEQVIAGIQTGEVS